MLLTFDVVAVVAGPIRPGLDAFTVLLVLLPVSFVPRAIEVAVDAEAMRLIVLPEAVVDVPVRVDEAALPVGLVILPPALVERTVGPDLDTLALPDARILNPKKWRANDLPFTFVLGTVLKQHHVAQLPASAQAIRLSAEVEIAQVLPNVLVSIILNSNLR